MKIKEIISPKDFAKFREVKEMDVERYVEWYVERERAGVYNNTPYSLLYEKACDVLNAIEQTQLKADLDKSDPIIEELNMIPLDEISFYSPKKVNLDIIKRTIPTLGALYTFLPSFGKKQKREHDVIMLQQILKERKGVIIKEYYDFKQIKSLPSTINIEQGFAENLLNAIKEFIEHIENRVGNKKYDTKEWVVSTKIPRIDAIKLYYLEGKTDDEIAKLFNLAKGERSRQIRNDEFLEKFFNGDILCSNLRIHDDLRKWMETIKEQCVFHSKLFLEKIAGIVKDKSDIHPLELDLVDVIDNIQFVIPRETKGIYSKLSNCLLDTLNKIVEPSTPTSIFEIAKTSDKFKKIDGVFDVEFVYNFLTCPEIVDIMDNGMVRIREELLKNNQDKAARLMYDLCYVRGNVTKEILSEEYEKKYNVGYDNISLLSRYGFNPTQKRGYIWHYGGSLEKTLQDAIKEYAENKRIFYYNEIEEYFTNKKYSIIKSFRAYITNVCFVDLKDSNHFCHKDYCDDYPDFIWRSQTRSGITNWILNKVNERLGLEEDVNLKEITDYIVEQSKNTVYSKNLKRQITFVFNCYTGDNQPFIIDNDRLRKNPEAYKDTDFNIIGIRGEKYPFFKRIRSIIANEIKKSKDNKLLLTEAIKLVNDSLEEQQNRNTIIRAIENKYLPSIGIELQIIDNNCYIVKSKDSNLIHAEPIYEAHTSEDNEIIVVEEQKVQERPSISYRLSVDWEKLFEALNKELNFYSKYMEFDKIALNDAIKKFISFIKTSSNSNLSKKLPQCLYEFCYASTDWYDRDRYLSDLAIFYEGLLYDIKNRNDIISRKRGLGDLALEFPMLARALSFPKSQARGFEKIFLDLYYKRNKVAHGDSLDLNSAKTALCILDYTALYVYTIAKYA